MKAEIAKELFDLQQKVIDRCFVLAAQTKDAIVKEELVEVSLRAMEVEKLLLVHIPKD